MKGAKGERSLDNSASSGLSLSQSMHLDERELVAGMEGSGALGAISRRARVLAVDPARVMVSNTFCCGAVGPHPGGLQIAVATKGAHEETSEARAQRQRAGDAALEEHLAHLARLAESNPWYKVELRIARAVVNIAGKFEADMASSAPVYKVFARFFSLPCPPPPCLSLHVRSPAWVVMGCPSSRLL